MAGLQRSAVSFRIGLIWDDKYLSGQLINQPTKHTEETNKKNQRGNDTVSAGEDFINNRWINREEPIQRRWVSPTVEPLSPKVSSCGLCSAINGKKGKSHHRLLRGQWQVFESPELASCFTCMNSSIHDIQMQWDPL